MDIQNLKNMLTDIFNEIKNEKGGKVANYIPQLGKMNPDLFGISACTVDGHIIDIGDTNVEFCLQSCSKPLTYCLVREELGRDKVHSHVGFEPSGQAFNAHVLNKQGLPHNPMINAGAMMVSSLLHPRDDPSERFEYVLNSFERISGNIDKINFDNSVFLSEAQHADRNLSLAYYMRENKAFDGDISSNEMQEHLDLYFQTCAITINTHIGSSICATLANGGICPITNEKIFSKDTIRDCLTLMYNCGMYDFSGQFSFEIGLPAKSGVSGCIFLVIPNVMGLCIWSPPLDDIGNSYKGLKVCKKIVEKFNYHIFDNIVSKNANNYSLLSDDVLTQKLINSAMNDDISTISKLIKIIDINKSDYDKRTALHIAAAEGNIKTVDFLLKNGCDKSLKDRWGNTALSQIEDNYADEDIPVYNDIKKLLY